MTTSGAARLFILGATGRTGRALVDQALARGHHVTVFVRAPQRLGVLRDGVTVVVGDAGRTDGLRAALPGHDAVLSTIGPPGLGPTTLVADCAGATVAAMHDAGVRRLVIVGMAALFEQGFLTALLRRTFLRNLARDSIEMERIVMASGLDWTIARPPRLTNGPPTGQYGAANDRMPSDGRASVRASLSRADVAHFLLEEVEHAAHVRRIVGLGPVS